MLYNRYSNENHIFFLYNCCNNSIIIDVMGTRTTILCANNFKWTFFRIVSWGFAAPIAFPAQFNQNVQFLHQPKKKTNMENYVRIFVYVMHLFRIHLHIWFNFLCCGYCCTRYLFENAKIAVIASDHVVYFWS